MNVLITGAQFSNKGAQSMLFTVVNEVREHYPDADFYYVPLDFFTKECFAQCEKYRFHFVFDDLAVYDYPIKFGGLINIKRFAENAAIKERIRKNHYFVEYLSDTWGNIDVMIDVSGYSLTSKFGLGSVNRLLRQIETAKEKSIPVILLPQSYGPFDFSEKTATVCSHIQSVLSKVDLLFVREEAGQQLLQTACGVKNSILSPDIVLQGKEIKWEHVFTEQPHSSAPVLETKNNVGVIPNGETVKNGNKPFVLSCYQKIIGKLLKEGKEVYIFRHSNDLTLCREIFEFFENDTHCHLIEDEMGCLDYSIFVKQFEFVIASRFHSIVHAYREGVPALILGWAVKYQELATRMGQEQYVFDITAKDQLDVNCILECVKTMSHNAENESLKIIQNLEDLRQMSCFEQCWGILDSIE